MQGRAPLSSQHTVTTGQIFSGMCDLNHINTGGYNWILSVPSDIINLLTQQKNGK